MNNIKINIIRNHASQGYLLSLALQDAGHEVNLFLPNPGSPFMSTPSKYIDIGKKYRVPLMRSLMRKIHRLRYPADLEISIGTIKQYSRASTRIIWWTGSDIINNPQSKNLPYPQFVATPDLLKISENFRLLNIMVDSNLFNLGNIKENWTFPNKEDFELIIGHFPTNPNLKGTKEILDFIEIKINDGINLILLTNSILDNWEHFTRFKKSFQRNYFIADTRREMMPTIYSICDFVIDQAVQERGLIATTGLEAMTMGVPVVCSIDPTLKNQDHLATEITSIEFVDNGAVWFDLENAKNILPKTYVSKFHTAEAAIKTLSHAGVI